MVKFITAPLIFLCLLCFCTTTRAQYDSTYYTREMFEGQRENMKIASGWGKLYPPQYELEILTALSHYPELKSVPIEFIELPINCTMMAQPRTKTLFDKRNRTYIIFINNSKETTGFHPAELSFNQFVGVVGHELGHLSYYAGRTAWQLVIDGIGYYFKDYRRGFEAGTDYLTIDHGLGWQLLDFSDYIMNKATLSAVYAKKKNAYYLTDQNLRQELQKRMTTSLPKE
jgi:hypothetical protein